MAASHFFVGLGAGIAILGVPVLTLVPGVDLPHRLATWIDGPPAQTATTAAEVAPISRPQRGYRPGDPTPIAAAPPTIAPIVARTPVQPARPQVVVQPPPSGSAMRTGVIRGSGTPVFVRRAAGVVSPDDPVLADGAPVLVSAGAALQVGGEGWRAVRGLSGIVGWVPGGQVVVDGESPPQAPGASNSIAARLATPTAAPILVGISPTDLSAERLRITNTDGLGVVLRNSPRDADRSRTGLTDGTSVSVVERQGADWIHVRTDAGQDGWVPARYIGPAPAQ